MNTKFIYITKAERRGTLLFFVVIFLIIIIQLLNINRRNKTNPEANREVLEILENKGILEKIKANQQTAPRPAFIPKIIDPNIASAEELEAIGMSSYAIKSLISYRSFTTIQNEEDLSQAYGIDSTMLQSIRPFIQYPKVTPVQKKSKKRKSPTQVPKKPIDPNTASREELIAIGFSKFSSNNIIKIREKGATLKGIEDIEKIYGVDQKTIDQVSGYLFFNHIESKPPPLNDTTYALSLPTVISTDTFDPNTATHEELVAQGISSKVSHTIINFRNGKKVFNQMDDLLNVYGMTPTMLDSLRDRIIIASSEISADSNAREITIDLSTTTTEELIKIDGIGKYFSEAIIKYGNSLGGYHSIEQLAEVPAMRPEIYDKIKDKFEITGKVKRFVPIALDFNEALSHPYMDFETTKLLYNLSANNYEKELDKIIKKGMVDSRLIPYLLAE